VKVLAAGYQVIGVIQKDDLDPVVVNL